MEKKGMDMFYAQNVRIKLKYKKLYVQGKLHGTKDLFLCG